MACRIKGKEFMMRTPSILFMMSVSVRLSAERNCPTFFRVSPTILEVLRPPAERKCRALFPHLIQKRFSVGIDEKVTPVRSTSTCFLCDRASTGSVHLLWICQFSFEMQGGRSSISCMLKVTAQTTDGTTALHPKEN